MVMRWSKTKNSSLTTRVYRGTHATTNSTGTALQLEILQAHLPTPADYALSPKDQVRSDLPQADRLADRDASPREGLSLALASLHRGKEGLCRLGGRSASIATDQCLPVHRKGVAALDATGWDRSYTSRYYYNVERTAKAGVAFLEWLLHRLLCFFDEERGLYKARKIILVSRGSHEAKNS